MNKINLIRSLCKFTLLISLFFILVSSSNAITDIMGIQMTFENSSISGDVNISIYDSASGGTLLYEEILIDNISKGEVDAMLGVNQDLNLEYGKDYFIEIIANGTDLDFNGADRQQFQSNIGNITGTRMSPDNITADLIADSAIDLTSKIVDAIITQAKLTFAPLLRSDNVAFTNESNTFTASLNTFDNDINIGGGYSGGGITLYGTGDHKGSGYFARDVLVDGELITVNGKTVIFFAR